MAMAEPQSADEKGHGCSLWLKLTSLYHHKQFLFHHHHRDNVDLDKRTDSFFICSFIKSSINKIQTGALHNQLLLAIWHKPNITWEEGTPTGELPRSDWPLTMSVISNGLVHCEGCHSEAGLPGCTNQKKPASKQHCSTACASVPLPGSRCGFYEWWTINLWDKMHPFLPKLFLVLAFITAIEHKLRDPLFWLMR